MSDVQLNLFDDDPVPFVKSLFDFLVDYLQPTSSLPASAMVSKLDNLFSSYFKAGKDNTSTFFWNVWEPFHVIALQLPYKSPPQDRLIECLKILRNTTGEIPTVEVVHGMGKVPSQTCRVWQDMYDFEGTFRALSKVLYHYHQFQKDANFEHNLKSYAMRLTFEGVCDLSDLGLEAFHFLEGKCLKQDGHRHGKSHSPSRFVNNLPPPKELDLAVAFAALWLQYAGTEMYRKIDDEKVITGPGPTWEMSGVSTQRWAYWKFRLGEIAEDGNIGEETKILARVIVRKMKMVEPVEHIKKDHSPSGLPAIWE